ncbi:hypothetical protein OS122_27930 [Mycolicibacterium mucogenicum]|uniref:Uncharacterized protein n=1 Tax=Mycolicibacterium aubagnense TaxID=319707 RepID=A0ABM7IMT6_9MYCO|nr:MULTISPECIES: hypothetical protein [Mycobacteriaceae]MCX8557096.1 hypothetical protein [Mycolicibacterium mucogenicum]MCX8564719.1 hypothetical protein [Mycolicibacterium mucogenicum]RUP29162.1 MAG: hypothetical protein EKK51_20960 [Mycolicibacterium sp.]BBX88114.1 hypothetical protein MAUB_63150 [Mycolicibacterium aubagnense]
MNVSVVTRNSLSLPVGLGWTVCAAGALGIVATYWDESWHTDIGRDSFWTPAHLMLYGAMAVVGLAIAAWGVRVLVALRSLRATLSQRPVVTACLGGVTALAAAPIDNAWHDAFGRDAVEWSPPHMLVIFAAIAIALGALAGIDPNAAALRAAAGALLLANAEALVFEYETGVPQFTETLYLPIMLAAGLLAAHVIGRAVPGGAPVTLAVAGYAALRLLIIAALATLGRSTPDLPLAVLGLAVYDLPLPGRLARPAAAALATATLAWGASALRLASAHPDAVAITAVPVIVISTLVLALGSSRRSRAALPAAVAVLISGSALATGAGRAHAHDPGQGPAVATVDLTADTDGRGQITMTARLTDTGDCEHTTPIRLAARRAGQTFTGDLRQTGLCRYAGTVTVPGSGRWFTYVELREGDDNTEAWLPVDAGTAGQLTQTRVLYRPAGTGAGHRSAEIAAGTPIYLVGIALLGLGAAAVRRSPHRHHGA